MERTFLIENTLSSNLIFLQAFTQDQVNKFFEDNQKIKV
jgi:hypothetical protein